MSLRRIFEECYAEAEKRATPERFGDAYRRLAKGAEIRVRSQGRRRQVVLSRQGAPVGDVEEVIFRRDGGIPPEAERRAYATVSGWHYVALTWEAPPSLWDGVMPEGELPPTL